LVPVHNRSESRSLSGVTRTRGTMLDQAWEWLIKLEREVADEQPVIIDVVQSSAFFCFTEFGARVF